MTPYYEQDGITLYCGDCRDILPQLTEKVDLVLTDPPYGITQNEWDRVVDLRVWWKEVDRVCGGATVLTCRNPFSAQMIVSNLENFKWSDIWKKTQSTGHLNVSKMPMRQHEDILVFGCGSMIFNPQMRKKPPANVRQTPTQPGESSNYGKMPNERKRTIPIDESYPSSIVEFPNSQEGLHPTQKPTELLKYLVLTYSNEASIILDPFCGSGTTLVSAKQLGRKAIGIEISERYCEIAVRRLAQMELFAA